MLKQLPKSTVEAELVANQISGILKSGELRDVENPAGRTEVATREQYFGGVLNAPVKGGGKVGHVGGPIVGLRLS